MCISHPFSDRDQKDSEDSWTPKESLITKPTNNSRSLDSYLTTDPYFSLTQLATFLSFIKIKIIFLQNEHCTLLSG